MLVRKRTLVFRWISCLATFILLAVMLVACAPAVQESKEMVAPVQPTHEEPIGVEEPEAEGDEPLVPEEPVAAEEPAAPESEDSVGDVEGEKPAPSLIPTPAPTFAPTPLPPTAQTDRISPEVEQRLVEVEWPPTMRLGESDIVRLSLNPVYDGYVLQAEYPEHRVVTQTVRIERPDGYELFAIARLDGVGFEVSPGGDQVQYLAPEQSVAWRWSLTPRNPGQQRLLVSLTMRWQPTTAEAGALRQVVVHSQALDVNVISFLGLTLFQAMFAGFFALLFGSGLSLFAVVVLRPRTVRQKMQVGTPNQALKIELPSDLILSNQERALLQTLFQRYDRLVIKDEFISGYSGARSFLALPVRSDGRADAYTIAKLGERISIQREFDNYEFYVKDTLPPITARIQRPPVTTNVPVQGISLAAIQYTFIGEPGASPNSLRQALLDNPDPRLITKIFDTFGPSWWLQRRPYTFRTEAEYDCLLPSHLVLEPATGRGEPLNGNASPGSLNLAVGDLVTLRDFNKTEPRSDGRSLSLTGQASNGRPALRVRWLSPEPPNGVCGRVTDTRWTLLRKYAGEAKLFGLPDPLPHLPTWLSEMVTGGQSTIHGDLNPENVLLGPGGLVWLIDFAQTRDGHTLYDFAHLEAEIIAHVISRKIHEPAAYLKLLEHPDKGPYVQQYELLEAVKSIAFRCLFNPEQPREYNLALTLACLGALKFVNLDAHARHFLYLSAAFYAQKL